MKTTTSLILMLFVSWHFSNPALGQSYDVVADFSAGSNPSGTWSYGYRTVVAGASFTKYVNRITENNVDWWYLPGTGVPNFGKTRFSGEIIFAPGNIASLTNHLSVVRWTAPSNNLYQVKIRFNGWDSRGINVRVYVSRNGNILLNEVISTFGETKGLTNSFALAAGDTLDFAVGNNDFPGNSDLTKLEVQIQGVPSALSIRLSHVELCWQTVTNTWYQLQYGSSLTTNQWQPLLLHWIAGNGDSFCTNDAIAVGEPQRYYRLLQTNAPPTNP